MWLRLQLSANKVIHIAVCYFALSTFHYSGHHGQPPYLPLYGDTMEFSSLGKVLLLRDFNARTDNEQTHLLDLDDSILPRELDIEGIRQQ